MKLFSNPNVKMALVVIAALAIFMYVKEGSLNFALFNRSESSDSAQG